MFNSNVNANDMKAEAERFALFDDKDVAEAIKQQKFTGHHFKLLSLKQLQAIDFSEIPQELVNSLFPTYSVEALRKAHSSWEGSFHRVNGKVLEDRSGYR
ncbi:MAG: hypothetical protein H0W50_07845, partial [Parachlamydiaceae bacterium]|nr:hypothetical protein [Parachlamydiaceae bacterium]